MLKQQTLRMRRWLPCVPVASLAVLLCPACVSAETTVRVSVSSTGAEGDQDATSPVCSADGRYVAFLDGDRLLTGQPTHYYACLLRDIQAGTTVSVVSSTGTIPAAIAGSPSITPDGRYIAYSLLPVNVTNPIQSCYLRDMQKTFSDIVSRDPQGGPANGDSGGPSVSDDGRYVSFTSAATNIVSGDTNGKNDIFVKDTLTNYNRCMSCRGTTQGNGDSRTSTATKFGQYAVFASSASNFFTGDTNGQDDIFKSDGNGSLIRCSLPSTGTVANGRSRNPSITSDGQYVVFESDASNLVPGDTNNAPDVFRLNTFTLEMARVSVRTYGGQAGGQNLNGLFPSISADGRLVAFTSDASDLVSNDINGQPDVFVHDMQTGVTFRVSLGANGEEGNGAAGQAHISADGKHVVFVSAASNLVLGDTNGRRCL